MLIQCLSYEELFANFKKGLRNGNWRKLRRKEKALYRAVLAYMKPKKSGGMARDTVNRMLLEKLLTLVERLKETKGMRIFKRGFKKAVEMLKNGEENGVFAWAPSLRYWLKDQDYIFWLGTVRW